MIKLLSFYLPLELPITNFHSSPSPEGHYPGQKYLLKENWKLIAFSIQSFPPLWQRAEIPVHQSNTDFNESLG